MDWLNACTHINSYITNIHHSNMTDAFDFRAYEMFGRGYGHKQNK